MGRRVFSALLGLQLLIPALGATRAVRAAEPSASELSVARRLFEEGRAAEEGGRWREAADKFRRALSIKETPGLRFHLARCEEEQGTLVEALVEYDRARELLDGGAKAADVEKLLAGARERVRAKVALLTLRLPDGVQNVAVELDGKTLSGSVLGIPMPIDPGRHHISAVAVGRQRFIADVELAAGEVQQLPVELPVATTVPAALPPPASNAQRTTAPASAPRGSDTAVSARTIVLLGEASLAVVGLGAGIGFALARSSADARFRQADKTVLAQVGGSDPQGRACDVPRDGCDELKEAPQDSARYGALSTAGFIAAGVSAAGFGLTYWLWPHRPAPVTIRASVSDRDFALGLSGTF